MTMLDFCIKNGRNTNYEMIELTKFQKSNFYVLTLLLN